MSHLLTRPSVPALCGLVLTTALAAQTPSVPQTMPFQGRLALQAGGNATGTLKMVFRIYGSTTGGTALWTETQNAVTVSKGLFKTELGSVTGFPNSLFDGKRLYLGVSVGADAEMVPRLMLTSQAYAQTAQNAKDVKGSNINPKSVRVAGSTVIDATGKWVGSSTGLTGPRGPKGDPGARGAAGSQGPKGDAGAKGATGLQGPKGNKGDTGPQGKVGATGPTGPQGASPFSLNGTTAYYTAGPVAIGASRARTSSSLYVRSAISSPAVFGEGNRQGVAGHATALTGIGVSGTASGSGGTGVSGTAKSSSGGTGVSGYGVVGVFGSSQATSGRGLFGRAGSLTGATSGVYGNSISVSGRGVSGHATATSGATVGVWGESASTAGFGVRGSATASTGFTFGVHGQTTSSKGFAVYAAGKMVASGTKSFVQPHPTNAAKNVMFVCLEGNESGTYFRGTARLVGGRAEIKIPEEWKLVTASRGITVQVTPTSLARLCVPIKTRDRIVVVGDQDCEFDYFVNGLRRGFTRHKSIVDNVAFVPMQRGVPYGTQYPKELRDILVQNGTLNPDYTPNEATARRLGWALQQPAKDQSSATINQPKQPIGQRPVVNEKEQR